MVKYITLNISFFLASILLPRTLMVQLLGNFNVFKGHFESLSNYMFKSKVKEKKLKLQFKPDDGGEHRLTIILHNTIRHA